MTIVLHVWRYYAREQVDGFDTVDDAVRAAYGMLDLNTAAAERIEVDGKAVMNRAQIEERWKELGLG